MLNCIKKIIYILGVSGILLSNSIQPTYQQNEEMLLSAFQIIWAEAMDAKAAAQQVLPFTREELLENLSSSAPAVYFTTHADLSDSLTQADNTSASIFVSTNNQNSWIENTDVAPINEEGYENTWGAEIDNDGNSSVSWYVEGQVDSEILGFDP